MITVDKSRCIACGGCAAVCNTRAIEIKNYPVINLSLCNDCGACVQVCPTGAIYNQETEHPMIPAYPVANPRPAKQTTVQKTPGIFEKATGVVLNAMRMLIGRLKDSVLYDNNPPNSTSLYNPQNSKNNNQASLMNRTAGRCRRRYARRGRYQRQNII